MLGRDVLPHYEQLMRLARERAKAESERMWPPGQRYSHQRRHTEDDLAIRYYREMAGYQ